VQARTPTPVTPAHSTLVEIAYLPALAVTVAARAAALATAVLRLHSREI
jgi:hypothetical protein